MIVLSSYQLENLAELQADRPDSVEMSPDLGLTSVTALITDEGIRFPDGELLPWRDAAEIRDADGRCFLVDQDGIQQVQVFSRTTNWSRSLLATAGAPTVIVSGFPMHRIKGTDPMADTLAKIRACGQVRGRVLDTATGLGYTAIEAAKYAREVVTVEVDPAAIAICRLNPWSSGLFDNPRISQVVGDIDDVIDTFDDGSFDIIIHDPPTMNIAGHLYGEAFYRKLYRVTARRGRVFHYIGDPTSRAAGRITTGVIRRLQAAGFQRVERKPEAFGVLAYR
jgi:predicted methyltransferase